ncbi:MAG TPA: nicotinate phosphoribosyltransferase [Verrucomicrobia bacterium]|nr:nicotinate phosphoribosyltransferase [Verrucomicrobiota bacterium]
MQGPVTTPNRIAGALLTDLYQLTMACGYWKAGKTNEQAVFHLFFRENPFDGGYTIAAGLADAIAFLEHFRFDDSDIEYLRGLTGIDGKPLFEPGFLDYLRALRFECDVDAIPEGTVVFPHEPLVRVQGSILQGQLVETALLNILNFQSLIATRASRICEAAQGDPVIEFGLRRAQGVDGAITASRAAFIGGCAGTSNALAGKIFGIPVKGTHAHSWVMSFENELAAFNTYADALPNNPIFLVDTYNTLDGVRHSVTVGRRLRERGYDLAGIRLDSGDLAYLSIEARRILDEAGFDKTAIVASNDLDERLIASLKQQGARINVWGVGTRLVTAYDQPALGGVYKLSAICAPDGAWRHTIKLSEQVAKITNPGLLQVRRFRSDGKFVGDAIYDQTRPLPDPITIVDPTDVTRRKELAENLEWEDLLVPVFRKGERVYASPSLEAIRERAQLQLSMLHPGIRRFDNPHRYPAGLELGLHDFKMQLILDLKSSGPAANP